MTQAELDFYTRVPACLAKIGQMLDEIADVLVDIEKKLELCE